MEEKKICPLCKTYEREPYLEPSPRDGEICYSTYCTRCAMRCGYQTHNHTHYPSPAQVKAGTYEAGHSWRTSATLIPIMDGPRHLGYRCNDTDPCGWEQRFTADELEICAMHQEPKGVCVNFRDHALERGECDLRGHITEFGREEERKRSDRDNWDPGRYIK